MKKTLVMMVTGVMMVASCGIGCYKKADAIKHEMFHEMMDDHDNRVMMKRDELGKEEETWGYTTRYMVEDGFFVMDYFAGSKEDFKSYTDYYNSDYIYEFTIVH